MPTTNLKNISIDERTTINRETYFLIKDNEQNQVYFCFQNKVREGWTDLVSNKEKIKLLSLLNKKGQSVFLLASFRYPLNK